MLQKFRSLFLDDAEATDTIGPTSPSSFLAVAPASRPSSRPTDTGKRTKYRSKKLRLQDMLDVLRQLDRTPVTNAELGKLLDLTSIGQVSALLGSLMEQGAVKRHGKPGRYWYTVHRVKVKNDATAYGYGKRKPEPVVLPKDPKLTPKQRTVLRFLERHQNELITGAQIAESLGFSTGSTHHFIKVLCRKGLLERSGPTVDGTRYRVVGESATAKQPVEGSKPETASEVVDRADLFRDMESLMWEYMKEHWDTNLLKFRKWLQQKLKG